MEAIEFIVKYPKYLQEIRDVIRPELFPLVDELEKIDPHDLVAPDTWFPNENAAIGFLWSYFIKRMKRFERH